MHVSNQLYVYWFFLISWSLIRIFSNIICIHPINNHFCKNHFCFNLNPLLLSLSFFPACAAVVLALSLFPACAAAVLLAPLLCLRCVCFPCLRAAAIVLALCLRRCCAFAVVLALPLMCLHCCWARRRRTVLCFSTWWFLFTASLYTCSFVPLYSYFPCTHTITLFSLVVCRSSLSLSVLGSLLSHCVSSLALLCCFVLWCVLSLSKKYLRWFLLFVNVKY